MSSLSSELKKPIEDYQLGLKTITALLLVALVSLVRGSLVGLNRPSTDLDSLDETLYWHYG